MSKPKRKICVITGTRAEYGLLKPLMAQIKKSSSLRLQVVAAGMHLARKFGFTSGDIEKDGFKIDAKVSMTPTRDDTALAMAKSVGKGIIAIADALARLKPDIVVILGDRVEVLAAAIAAAYFNIPIAHIHGGDNTMAGLDEYARHAITKLSHLHFPATEKSARRIIKMGEDPFRVKVVGAPGLDSISRDELFTPKETAKRFRLDLSKPVLLVVQHPLTTEIKNAAPQMKETMQAVKELGRQAVVIYPNADAGGRSMIKVINKYRKCSFIRIYKSLAHKEYLSLMKIADVMVGNSSSGIIEAPSFKLAAVNIGSRQYGRERAENVIDVAYDKGAIKRAIRKALYDKKFKARLARCKSPYCDAKASERMAEFLSGVKLGADLLRKRMTY